jgi:CheY-like chemotaxis protein
MTAAVAATPLLTRAEPRVLVVEPDDDIRALHREALRLSGYQVIESTDGRDALAKALTRPPALVVTGLRLAFIDGFALCEILRRDSQTDAARILVITSESQPSELARARLAGADRVLVKPVASNVLVREARQLLTSPPDSREAFPRHAMRATAADVAAHQRRRTVLAKAHARFSTSTPPIAPPALTCPTCDRALTYERSHIGGVSERHQEQWDYYTCAGGCGAFEYRQRTRKIRPVR